MKNFTRTNSNGHDPITNTAYVSKLNKIKVLNHIRNRQSLTRPEIAKEIGLSLPTVNRLVDSLIFQDGLVKEVGKGASTVGRPPKLIEFAGADHYVIGISIGNTYISGLLTDLNAQIITEHRISTTHNHSFNNITKRTAKLVNDLVERSGIEFDQVLGIGLAIGGVIDVHKNQISYSAGFDWKDKDIGSALGELIDKPIIFDNNARVMALGELWYGIGDRISNFVCILLGYRIGAAFIMDRSPFFGSQGMVGEFGHAPRDPHSNIECSCGNYGCMEVMGSGSGIARHAQEGLQNTNQESLLREMCDDLSNITAEKVAQAANQGDAYAIQVMDQAAYYIGVGIANLINLNNPRAVVFGGGLIKAGDKFLQKIQETARQRALKRLAKDVLFQKASLGQKSKEMGAVALILNEILNLNIVATPPTTQASKVSEPS